MLFFDEPKSFPGQDPWVISHEGQLLLLQSYSNRITVTLFDDLARMAEGKEVLIWTAPQASARSDDVWAPELHHIDGRWYVYYTACEERSRNQRTYVLEADHPLGPYRDAGKICDTAHDVWANDLTVLRHEGRLYAVWSGWDGPNDGFPQNLYIAPMADPLTIAGERTLISRPDRDWEMSVAPVNEGPTVLRGGSHGKLFIVYSADASWTTAYKMGVLEWTGGDVTDPRSWWKLDSPIFTAGGHASFVEIEREWYVVYHRKSTSDPGWADREIHWAHVRWDSRGYPVICRRGHDARTSARRPGESDQAAAPTLGPHVTAGVTQY